MPVAPNWILLDLMLGKDFVFFLFIFIKTGQNGLVATATATTTTTTTTTGGQDGNGGLRPPMDPLRAEASSLRTDSTKTRHMPPRDTHLSREVSIRVRRPPETTAPSLAECVLDLGTQGPRSSPCNQVPTKLVPPFPLSQWVYPTKAKIVPCFPRFPRASCPRLGKDATSANAKSSSALLGLRPS